MESETGRIAEVCLICNQEYSLSRYPNILDCCGKTLCHACCEKIINISSNKTCPFCRNEHIFVKVDLALAKKSILISLEEREHFLKGNHVRNFETHKINMQNILKFYTSDSIKMGKLIKKKDEKNEYLFLKINRFKATMIYQLK